MNVVILVKLCFTPPNMVCVFYTHSVEVALSFLNIFYSEYIFSYSHNIIIVDNYEGVINDENREKECAV